MKKQIIILSMAAFFAAAGMAAAQSAPEKSQNMKHMQKTVEQQTQSTSGTRHSHMMMQDSTDRQPMKMMGQQGEMMNDQENMMQKHMAMMEQMMAMHKTMMQDTVMKKKMMAMMQENGISREDMQTHMKVMQKCMAMQKMMMQDKDNMNGEMKPMNMDHHNSKQNDSRPEMKTMDKKTGMDSSPGPGSPVLALNNEVNYKTLK